MYKKGIIILLGALIITNVLARVKVKAYEEKLSLVRKFQSIKDKINTMKAIVSDTTNTGDIT